MKLISTKESVNIRFQEGLRAWNKGEYAVAYSIWTETSKFGHAESFYQLGQCHELGMGVEKNAELAELYYKKAAKYGSKNAKKNGLLKSRSNETRINFSPKDYLLAIIVLAIAAGFFVHGYDTIAIISPEIYYNMAEKKFAKRSIERAIFYYKKAAIAGYEPAQLKYAKYSYTFGDNKKEAISWYKKLAEQGDLESQLFLGEYCNNEINDKKQSFYWYKKAAEQENIVGQYKMAEAYAYGEGVAKDEKKAVEYYRKAAKQGHEGARFLLERYYKNY